MQSACAVLYCHLWPIWLYHIFPHYLINDTIFGKKLLNIKCVFWFSLQLLSETLPILKWIARDIIINLNRSSCQSCQILMKVEFSGQILEKFANIKFHENLSSESRVVPCGRTDRHTWLSQQSLFAISRTRLKGSGNQGRPSVRYCPDIRNDWGKPRQTWADSLYLRFTIWTPDLLTSKGSANDRIITYGTVCVFVYTNDRLFYCSHSRTTQLASVC
jgi:hypothetical protein